MILEQTITMVVLGTFSGILGAMIVHGILAVVQFFNEDTKVIRQADLERALAKQEQFIHNVISYYKRTGGLSVTDDRSLVSQYYGKEDETKLSINNLWGADNENTIWTIRFKHTS